MNGYWIAAGSALWLGILTSISRFPLATNITAIPALYVIGPAVPILAYAILLVFGKQSFSMFFKKVTRTETWLRRITGNSILAVGIFITVQQVFLR